MTQHVNPPVTPSAAAHAERIRQGQQRSESASSAAGGRQTAELYGARALAQVRADEALREEARRNEMRARGQWVPGDDETDEFEEDEQEPEDSDEEFDEEVESLSTAERYALIERARREAEHRANLVAQKGAGQPTPPPQVHRYAAQGAQPHRYAHLWQKPAS